jgi:hypothetical protein
VVDGDSEKEGAAAFELNLVPDKLIALEIHRGHVVSQLDGSLATLSLDAGDFANVVPG